jgi:DNA-binding NtrC family response regulator
VPAHIRQPDARVSGGSARGQHESSGGGEEEWPTLSDVEGRYVARVLAHTGGNKQAAARLLRVDPKTLDRIIKRHNLNAGRVRK